MRRSIHENGKLFHFFQFFEADVGVLKFPPNICVAISEEALLARAILTENLYINPADGRLLLICKSYLELTVGLLNLYFYCNVVEGAELLLATTCHFNNNILVLKFIWQIDS